MTLTAALGAWGQNKGKGPTQCPTESCEKQGKPTPLEAEILEQQKEQTPSEVETLWTAEDWSAYQEHLAEKEKPPGPPAYRLALALIAGTLQQSLCW